MGPAIVTTEQVDQFRRSFRRKWRRGQIAVRVPVVAWVGWWDADAPGEPAVFRMAVGRG